MTKYLLSAAVIAVFSMATPAVAADAAKQPSIELGAVDKNKDGAVSKDEADAIATAQYASLDADKNGKVTADEYKAQIYKMHKTPPPADRKADIDKGLARQFSMLDANKDGSLTKAEYMEDATKRHKAMDLNGDGKVTKAELTELQDKIKAEMKKRMAAAQKAPAKK